MFFDMYIFLKPILLIGFSFHYKGSIIEDLQIFIKKHIVD
jgi:hypothetical protein